MMVIGGNAINTLLLRVCFNLELFLQYEWRILVCDGHLQFVSELGPLWIVLVLFRH